MKRAKIFIGSSTEQLDVAYTIQKALEYCSEPTVWTQGVFELTQSSLSSLLRAVDLYEYAVFVLTPDDILTLREDRLRASRDNVIFELGLFVGRYGASNVFIVLPRGVADFHIPTDLLGIKPATYDPNRVDGNLAAALGPACFDIQQRILELSVPKYSEETIKQFETLVESYRLALLTKIGQFDIPPDFPMPEDINKLEVEQLYNIKSVMDSEVDMYNPHAHYLVCSVKLSEGKGVQSKVDDYVFKKDVEHFSERLNKWKRESGIV